MSANAVIAGTFSDFKIVKSRRAAQIIVEVPLERAEAAISILGMPRPEAERWVAIAPLAFNPSQPPTALGTDEGQRAVTAAVLRCKEPDFQRFLLGPGDWTEDDAAQALYERLDITSRREIGTKPGVLARWKALSGAFMEAQRHGQ